MAMYCGSRRGRVWGWMGWWILRGVVGEDMASGIESVSVVRCLEIFRINRLCSSRTSDGI